MSEMASELARVSEATRNNERRIDNHEDICSQRYGEIAASFIRVHDRLDTIMKGVITLVLTLLLTMTGGAVTVLIRALGK